MRRYLVVANQTLAGQELYDEIERRIEAGDAGFRVLVPVTRVGDLAGGFAVASGSGAAFPVVGSEGEHPRSDEAAWDQARTRMNHLVGRIRDRGAEVSGELGESDPYTAIRRALDQESFDEIILSTLPSGISRWLGMDLPSRVERTFEGPVTTIVAGG
jgi:hypothetical protein